MARVPSRVKPRWGKSNSNPSPTQMPEASGGDVPQSDLANHAVKSMVPKASVVNAESLTVEESFNDGFKKDIDCMNVVVLMIDSMVPNDNKKTTLMACEIYVASTAGLDVKDNKLKVFTLRPEKA